MGADARIYGRHGGANEFDAVAIDAITNALTIVDYAHHEIHGGSAFFVQYSVADLGAMTTPNDAITLSFKTPNTPTKLIHLAFGAYGSAGTLLKLVEAPTGGVESPSGQLAIINHHRNSSSASTVLESTGTTAAQVDYDATLATGGTTLWTEYLGGSGGPHGGASAGGARDEIILKPNTVYQVSIFGTANDPAGLYLNWYEHTNKR